MIVLDVIAWGLLALVAVPCLVFLGEALTGLLPPRRAPAAQGPVPRAIVLMPAHNEAPTIGATLDRLLPELGGTMSLLLVADNCSDDTAAIARAAGATVTERHDPARRGKGFALAHGRDVLRTDPPECVLVIDADAFMDRAGMEALAQAGAVAPVQGRNLLRDDLSAPAMVQISNLAFLTKNLVRQRGLARLGMPAVLGGTGMALPWSLFDRARLATDDIVEDLGLGIDLLRAGHAPRYLDSAELRSGASSGAGTLTQRTRWERGFLGTARRRALPLVGEGLRTQRLGVLWMGLHLLVPPLALLVMVLGVVCLGDGLLWLAGTSPLPFALAVVLFVAVALVVLAVWALHGRRTLAPRTLVMLPLYLLWKAPIYLGLLRRRASGGWTRSDRG